MYELKSKQYNALKGSLSCAQIGVSYKHHLYSIGTYNNDHIIHIQNQTHYDANHTHIYQSHSSITLIFINHTHQSHSFINHTHLSITLIFINHTHIHQSHSYLLIICGQREKKN